VIELLQNRTAFPQINDQRLEDIPWEDGPREVHVTDVKQKVLWINDDTDASCILLKSPADPRHAVRRYIHPNANQWSYARA
jgi:hypothetical protein